MSNSFPSMICNEPPPLDSVSEDDDSEDFRDFHAAGLKLDILGDPSPQQSPLKTSLKGKQLHNGVICQVSENSSASEAELENCENTVLNNSNEVQMGNEELVVEAVNNSNSNYEAKVEHELNFDPAEKLTHQEDSESSTDFQDCEPSNAAIKCVASIADEEVKNKVDMQELKPSNKWDSNTENQEVSDEGSIMILSQPNQSQLSALSYDPAEEEPVDKKDLDVYAAAEISEAHEDDLTIKTYCEVLEAIRTVEINEDLTECTEVNSESCEDKCQTSPVEIESSGGIQFFDANEAEVDGFCDSQVSSITISSPLFHQHDFPEPFMSPSTENTNVKTDTGLEFERDEPDEFGEFETAFSSLSVVEPSEKKLSESERTTNSLSPEGDDENEDFGDFEAFHSTAISNVVSAMSVRSPVNNIVKTSYIGMIESEDEFGSFTEASGAVQFPSFSSAQGLTSPIIGAEPMVEDEFGTFQEFQSNSECSLPLEMQTQNQERLATQKMLPDVESKLELLIKSVFHTPNEVENVQSKRLREDIVVPIDKELNDQNSNEEWSRVQDFEGSQGLMFKWLSCNSHERLLKSLKIDTTTVMYTGKWGTIEVPRFAASIVDSPLQPQMSPQSNSFSTSGGQSQPSDRQTKTTTNQLLGDSVQPQETVNNPRAQSTRGGQLSAEAQRILEQIPDLSFLRAKTLVFPSESQNVQN